MDENIMETEAQKACAEEMEEKHLEYVYNRRREILNDLMKLTATMEAHTKAAREKYDAAIDITVKEELDGDWGYDVVCTVKQHLENTKAILDRFIEDF